MALPGDQALTYTSLRWPFLFKPPDKHKHLLDSVIENYNQEDNLSPKKKKSMGTNQVKRRGSQGG